MYDNNSYRCLFAPLLTKSPAYDISNNSIIVDTSITAS